MMGIKNKVVRSTCRLLLTAVCMFAMLVPALALAVELNATTYPTTIDASVFTSNGTYELKGEFAGDLKINVPAGMTVTLDGSGATFKGAVRITLGKIASNANDLTTPRVGEYTIKGFVMEKGLGVGCNAVKSVMITNNQVGAVSLNCSNSKVSLIGNTINSTGTSYARIDAGTHKGGIHVYSDGYDITLKDNVITSQDQAITVVGEYGWHAADFENKWTIEDNTLIGKNRIFKVWNDKTYAPVEWPADYRVTDEMLALAEQIYAENNLPQPCAKSAIDVLLRKTNGPDKNATEDNFEQFIAIKDQYVKAPVVTVVNKLPQTGDNSSLALWSVMLLFCALTLSKAKRLFA